MRKKLILITFIVIIGIITWKTIFQGYQVSDKFKSRYGSGISLKSWRAEEAINSLANLEPHEFVVGVGLSSVMYSGPHNDFIRWTQRVGIFVMLIGVCPFFLAAIKCYRKQRRSRSSGLYLFLLLAILFTLYHSIFGYPREDAYQAPFCFLGLALWLGYTNQYAPRALSHNGDCGEG